MAWIWETEGFNRSDRPLHGDAVGASSLTWASYRGGPTGSQAKILANAPVPKGGGSGLSEGLLLSDVAALAAGAPILGIGAETQMLTRPGSPNYSWYAALPPEPGGQGIWFHTSGQTGTLYLTTNHRLFTGARVNVGMVAITPGVPTFTGSGQTALTGNERAAAPGTGDIVRLEVVFGGSITVYKNGEAVLSASTPGAVGASHTLTGAAVNASWYTDNWRVGVLV